MPTISVACQGTCTQWCSTLDMCSPCDDYAMDAVLLDDCIDAASDILFELSGRRFAGVCQDTVRPCGRSDATDNGRPIRGYDYGGYGCSCNSSRRCGCASVSEITLGAYPVNSIVSVKVDGETLDSSTYRIDDNRYLVRLPDADGTNPGWPCCQDMSLADTEDDTWSVTFTYGSPPPAAGVKAAAELACQLALACQPEDVGRCRLPQRVTQITRQGTTAVLLDPFDFLDNGKTGIYSVDLFLRTYNPKGLRQRATVINPERSRRVRRLTA